MCLPQPFFSPCALPFHLPPRFHLPGWSLVTSPLVCPTHPSFTPQIWAMLDYFSPDSSFQYRVFQLRCASSAEVGLEFLFWEHLRVSVLIQGCWFQEKSWQGAFQREGCSFHWYCSFLLSEDLDFPSLPCAILLAAGEQLLLACLGFF